MGALESIVVHYVFCQIKILRFVLDLFSYLPSELWPAGLAGFFALSGVYLSNRNGDRRFRLEIKAAREAKEIERLSNLRSNIYLPLADAQSRVGPYLMGLATSDPAMDSGGPLTVWQGLAAQVYLVANEDTVEAIEELNALYSEAYAALLELALPVHFAGSDIDIADQYYKDSVAEQRRALAEARLLHESAAFNPERFRALQSTIEHASKEAEKYASQRQEAQGRKQTELKRYQALALERIASLDDAMEIAVEAIRREIGLSTDSQVRLQRRGNHRRRAKQALEGLHKALEREALE